jgi:hypothetical protein
MKKSIILLVAIGLPLGIYANNGEKNKDKTSDETSSSSTAVDQTFKTTRVVNAHSVESLKKNELDFRITHRFGDIGGSGGGGHTLYGLDNSTDIRIALEYGISNKFDVGFGRSKGAGPQREVFDGYIKYQILKQTTDNKIPVSLTLVETASYTGMEASEDETSALSFDNAAQRMGYSSQLLIGRKFGERFSMQVMPTYVYRNYVAFEDENGIFSTGVAGKLQITKSFAFIAEYYQLFTERNVTGVEFKNPLAFELEFDTGGHVFHVNFTNSAGLGETQFIPNTISDWADGQFRFGFTISRIFKL